MEGRQSSDRRQPGGRPFEQGKERRPSLLTPTKAAALRTVNKQNRSFTLRQVSDQLKEIGLDDGTETVRRWFKKEGAAKVARRIKPSLTTAQKERRIDFICDQVDETTGEYLDICLLYTSPSPRDATLSRMPSSA